MAKVSLRVYNREIESMIEGGQLNEAVAHCQYILKTYPMHVETYRLLGKCFLEARRYADAADIFQRALMAVPDDFVSHVGMSIIRDDEGKLDEAIWHMERAFEDQPSNPAIQGELRRLYGRRDGTEPPKIRLSRDALANMYAQGELFNQAIAEIRSVLAEDANRPDLQVMLARAYYRAGQIVEAAEIAATLLKKYTYCMDALRILVDALPGTALSENTQVYRQRLRMLDPYTAFVTGSIFNTDQVADVTVTLERLEYNGEAAQAPAQPNWAASLGIQLADEKRAEAAPDWLAASDPITTQKEPEPNLPKPEPVATAEDNTVPEFMRNSGWQESSGKVEEGPLEFSPVQPDEPLAQADIPDWLKSMAPKEVTDAESNATNPNQAPQAEDDSSDWLAGLENAAAAANLGQPQPSTSPQEDIPEWLNSGPAEAARPTQPTPSTNNESPFPDWLKKMGDGVAAATESAMAKNMTEPTSTPEPTVPPVQPNPEPDTNQPIPQNPEAVEPAVKPGVSPFQPGEETPFRPTGESKPLNIEDDAMAWLEGLAAKQGAKPEELLTKPEDRMEEMPDWLRPAMDQPSVPDEKAPTRKPPDTLPLEPINLPGKKLAAGTPAQGGEYPQPTPPLGGISKPLNTEDDSMAWLEGLTANQDTKPEEPTKVEEQPEEMPDWLRADEKQTPTPSVTEPVATTGAKATTMPEETTTAPETPQEDITITSWLSKLDVEEALGKARQTPAPEQPAPEALNELPDWLKDLEKPSATEEPPKPIEDLPSWLREPAQTTDQGEPLSATPAAMPGQEMPTWIDETAQISEPPAPTAPEEWIPVDEKPGAMATHEPVQEPKTFTAETQVQPPLQHQVQPPIIRATGMLSRVPALEKDAEILAAAQAELDANRLNEAMNIYAKLIKKNRLLDEVIHDLREAIYRFPVDIIVWQTLGDASMRANRLQDALDAYTKAEELLR